MNEGDETVNGYVLGKVTFRSEGCRKRGKDISERDVKEFVFFLIPELLFPRDRRPFKRNVNRLEVKTLENLRESFKEAKKHR